RETHKHRLAVCRCSEQLGLLLRYSVEARELSLRSCPLTTVRRTTEWFQVSLYCDPRPADHTELRQHRSRGEPVGEIPRPCRWQREMSPPLQRMPLEHEPHRRIVRLLKVRGSREYTSHEGSSARDLRQ